MSKGKVFDKQDCAIKIAIFIAAFLCLLTLSPAQAGEDQAASIPDEPAAAESAAGGLTITYEGIQFTSATRLGAPIFAGPPASEGPAAGPADSSRERTGSSTFREAVP